MRKSLHIPIDLYLNIKQLQKLKQSQNDVVLKLLSYAIKHKTQERNQNGN